MKATLHFKLTVLVCFSFILFTQTAFAQEPKPDDHVGDKVVIGFPGITTAQLNSLHTEFLKYDQISDAKFMMGVHNCMLLVFDGTKHDFTTYAELLKVISPFYNTNNCYFKVKTAFAEINNNVGTDTVIEVK